MDYVYLYIVRHGQTSLNAAGRFRGEADPPLDTKGVKDAEEVVNYFKSHHVIPEFIVSSDKKRAVQTADIISKAFSVDPVLTEDLRAWDLGRFSGKPKSKQNLEQLQYYIQDPDLRVPDGESLNDFRGRILPVLEECFKRAMEVGTGIIVAHSSVVHETGTQIDEDHKSLLVEPGGIVAVGLEDGEIVGKKVFKPLKDKEGEENIS